MGKPEKDKWELRLIGNYNFDEVASSLQKMIRRGKEYEAYFRAVEDVRRFGNLPVPLKVRNPVTRLMKEIGYGEGYEKYSGESNLPDKLKGKKYYNKGG